MSSDQSFVGNQKVKKEKKPVFVGNLVSQKLDDQPDNIKKQFSLERGPIIQDKARERERIVLRIETDRLVIITVYEGLCEQTFRLNFKGGLVATEKFVNHLGVILGKVGGGDNTVFKSVGAGVRLQ